MFILRLIAKIVLIPVWILVGIAELAVHIVVGIFGTFHGIWKTFFTIIGILALCFGMWQNSIVCIIAIMATFLILLAGAFVNALLSITRESIGRLIIG